MTAEQLLALLATIADLRITAERLQAENEQLRQIIAECRPDDAVPAVA